MDLKANGKGSAFGKASEKENTLENALNIECKNLKLLNLLKQGKLNN